MAGTARYYYGLTEVKALRVECMHDQCRVSVSIPLNKKSAVPDKCPSCSGEWGPQSVHETGTLREILKNLEALGKGENKYI